MRSIRRDWLSSSFSRSYAKIYRSIRTANALNYFTCLRNRCIALDY